MAGRPLNLRGICLAAVLGATVALGAGVAAPATGPLRDKTLVVWASPANLAQQGGSALTLDDGRSHFDGIVFGELQPHTWMAGSDFYRRTSRPQQGWPGETAGPGTLVQIAITYREREVTLYRNGTLYARYTMAEPPQEFGPDSVVLFGRRHLEAQDRKNSFTGLIRDARVYAGALDAAVIRTLAPGSTAAGPKPWAWWSFADQGLREMTGRFRELRLEGDLSLTNGCLALGGGGASLICSPSEETQRGEQTPRTWSPQGAVPEEVVRSARALREKFLADPARPTYHFCLPEDMGQPGDPNGAFFKDGVYHLMYLYNRVGSGFCWGHVSSHDLVHWRHHPDAIGPGQGDEGCFSGGAFLDDDGTAVLSYWMLWGARGIGLARAEGPDYDHWVKEPGNPVIASTEWGVTELKEPASGRRFLGSADPSNIWKRGGHYYLLTGNLLVLNKLGRAADAPVPEQGDRLYLFTSDDLKNWRFLHVFYERKPEWTDRGEDNMCPSFLPLPSSPEGGPPSGKHLLLFISHNRGCQYYIGDYQDDHFLPGVHGRMTWTDNTFFAPEALVDSHGRQIMWAWLTDNPSGEKERGWSGVYGVPRCLWLGADGTLRMRPVPELETLHGPEHSWGAADLEAGGTRVLEGIRGDTCDLHLRIDPLTTGRAGVRVRASTDGTEQTLLYFDAAKKELVFDATRSGSDGRRVVERAPLATAPGEPVDLRILVDKSVVEVYANDRQAITRRVYPARAGSTGLALFAEGTRASFHTIRGWDMHPANPY